MKSVRWGRKSRFFIAGLTLVLSACLTDPGEQDLSQNQGLVNDSIATFTVDSNYIGAYPALAIAPDGSLHASYYSKDWTVSEGGALRHAEFWNGIWTPEVVDGNIYDSTRDVGRNTSIAADDTGGLHVAYWDVTNADLKYATFDVGSGWRTQIVANAGSGVYPGSDLQLYAGMVYIVYYGAGQVWLASKAIGDTNPWTSPWASVESVALMTDDPKSSVAMEFDSNGDLHVAFFDSFENKIKYTVRVSDVWQLPVEVTTLVSEDARVILLLDGSDVPQIIYYDLDGEELKHVTLSGTSWQQTMIAGVGTITLGLSEGYLGLSGLRAQDGQLHVVYYAGQLSPDLEAVENQNLMHAYLDEGVWFNEILESTEDVGRTSAMTEDPADGTIHVIYRDTTNNYLKYLYF